MEQGAELPEPSTSERSEEQVSQDCAVEAAPLRRISLPASWRTRIHSSRTWIANKAPNGKQVSLASFVMMGVSDAATMSGTFARIPIQLLGTGAGAGLILTSLHDIQRTEQPHAKLDAASNLAWGYQGLLALSSSSVMRQAARGLGVTGALIQTTMGVTRIRHGLVQGDGMAIKIGALDLGGGLLWLGWDLLAWQQPLLVGGYVLLGVTKEGLANRSTVAGVARKVKGRASRMFGALAAAVESAARGAAEDTEQLLLQLREQMRVENANALDSSETRAASAVLRADRQGPRSAPTARPDPAPPAPAPELVSSRRPQFRIRVRIPAPT